MPKYDKDLVTYLGGIGEDTPDLAMIDTDFRRRCLSMVAPMALVSRVARSLDNIDDDPVVGSLNDFERGRIFQALGRRGEAASFYQNVVSDSNDPELKGCSLVNLSHLVDDPEEKEKLLRDALDGVFFEAAAPLGILLQSQGRLHEAVHVLYSGIRAGEKLCVPPVFSIARSLYEGEELDAFIADLLLDLRRFGYVESLDDIFVEFHARVLFEDTEKNPLSDFLKARNTLYERMGIEAQ